MGRIGYWCAAVGSLALAAAACGQVRFELLTDFGDTSRQRVFGISGDGSTVVGSSTSQALGEQAVRWQDQSYVSLGPGVALATDHTGSTVTRRDSSSGWMFRYRNGEQLQLRSPDGGSRAGYPTAVSHDGEVIGGYFHNQSWDEAFLWTEAGGLIGLGLGNGYQQTRAFGLTPDAAIVVGEAELGGGVRNGFRWTANAGYELLRGDQGEPAMEIALDVDATGDFVVGRATNGRAAYWTPAGGTVPIPGLQSRSQGWAYAVTPGGSTIVGTDIDGGDSVAFLWSEDDGLRSLADVLLTDYGLDLGDFVLETARGISDDGLTFTGTGRFAGSDREHAWVVTVPGPPTVTLLAGLGLALVRRR